MKSKKSLGEVFMDKSKKFLVRLVIAIIFAISGVVQFVNQEALFGVFNLAIAVVFGCSVIKMQK